jgi:hypothetical protein
MAPRHPLKQPQLLRQTHAFRLRAPTCEADAAVHHLSHANGEESVSPPCCSCPNLTKPALNAALRAVSAALPAVPGASTALSPQQRAPRALHRLSALRTLQALQLPQVSPAANVTLACTPQDGVCSVLSSLYNAAGLAPLNLTGWASAGNGTNTSYCTFAGVNCTNGTLTSMCVGRSPLSRRLRRVRRLCTPWPVF